MRIVLKVNNDMRMKLLHMKGHYFEFKIEKDKIFEIMMQNVRYFDLMLTYCKER